MDRGGGAMGDIGVFMKIGYAGLFMRRMMGLDLRELEGSEGSATLPGTGK